MIVHIVMFKFKEENKKENILKTKKLLEQLNSKIKELISIEIGINFDQAQRAMDMSIYTKFKSQEDLNNYSTNSEHLKVNEFIKEVTEYTKVSDYCI